MDGKNDLQTIMVSRIQHINHGVCRPSARWVSQIARIGAPVLLTVLAACAPQPHFTPTALPASATAVPPTATSTPVEPTPTLPAAQTPSPSAEGEWILVNTEKGLWTARPDGSDGALRITGPLVIPGPLAGAVSSADGNFAYLTTTDFTAPYGNYPNLTLNIISLFGRGPFVSLPLTSPQTEPGTEFPSDIIRAMVEHTSFAWSPEGKRLAYIGAAQGPSADVYEYQRETGAVQRLTDGPDQAYDPLWSPDGKWIAHTAAPGFGTGAGIPVTGFYAARADGSGVISLYDISKNSGGEYGLGWLDAHTLVTNSWYITCGFSDVRLTDLSAQKTDLVFKGCLSAAAVGGGAVLFAQSPDTARFDENPRPGLFLLAGDNRVPRKISDADIRDIVWSEANGSFLAIAMDNRIYEISPSGDIRTMADTEPRIPTVSPDGKYWALSDSSDTNGLSGVWVGEYGQALRQVFPDKISPGQILFFPPGNTLYFLDATGNLYLAHAPDWAPVHIASNLMPASSELAMAYMLNDA